MPQSPTPNLLDVTVRDGSNLLNHLVSPELVSKVIQGLWGAGIKYAEVSHGLGIGGKLMGYPGLVDDEELLEAAKNAAPDMTLSVFLNTSEYSQALIPALVDFFEIGRIGTNVDCVQSTEKVLKKLIKYKKTASVNLVRCHAHPPEQTAKAAKLAEEMGASIVYIVDTFGSMTPKDVENYTAAIKANSKIEIGFHGHNHIHLAVPNTLAAWNAGASWLDATLMGVGRDAGNARLETMVELFHEMDKLTEISLDQLCSISDTVILKKFKSPPYSKYIDLLCSELKIDFSPSEILEALSRSLSIPLRDFLIKLKNELGPNIQVTEDHLKSLMETYDQDYETLISHLSTGAKKR